MDWLERKYIETSFSDAPGLAREGLKVAREDFHRGALAQAAAMLREDCNRAGPRVVSVAWRGADAPRRPVPEATVLADDKARLLVADPEVLAAQNELIYIQKFG